MKHKGILISLLIVIIVIIFVFLLFSRNWPLRFKKEFDNFFGEKNWNIVDKKTKDTHLYQETTYSKDFPDVKIDGVYKKWSVKFNKDTQEYTYEISDLTYNVNHRKYDIFNLSKLYSKKQALILEFMNISMDIASDKLYNEVIKTNLSENQSNCFSVKISYHNGNPPPHFYNKLVNESWFNIQDSDVSHYLETDLYEFYIKIRVHDYKFNKLSNEEKQEVYDKVEIIEKELLDKYKDNASFEIWVDSEHIIEYKNGVKIK